jgi:hypothetical protein
VRHLINEGVAGFPNLNLSAPVKNGTFQMDGIPPGEYLAGLRSMGPEECTFPAPYRGAWPVSGLARRRI